MNVSVIIPTLNAERWISQQLNMLLSQTVEAEIIAIDSGSSDGTPGLQLLAAPSGCAFCDQNDVWDVGKLEITASMLEQVLLIVLSEKQYEGVRVTIEIERPREPGS